jgi:hypothetical protein
LTIHKERTYKFLDAITVAFAVVIIISNLIGAVKAVRINLPFAGWGFSCTAGLFLFPLSYLIGDVLTEVYGYAKSRKVIWTGFGALIFANLIVQFFNLLPANPSWGLEHEFNAVFQQSLRLSAASMIAYFCGEFTNSYIVAKFKILNAGKNQAFRIIFSTVAGELVDTILVLFLGFYGAPGYPLELIIQILITNYIFKVTWEVIAYPVFTVHLLRKLKKIENEDYYDYDTDLNPFHLKASSSQ